MFRVGLTGSMGSGKSTVAEFWRSSGADVIDADVLARRAVEPGTAGLDRVVAAFGPEILDPEGRLDRARMREFVFRDPGARRRLEVIIHPAVERLRREAESRLEREGAGIVVHEIPLLFEAGLEDDFDLIVLVDAPEEARLGRVMGSRGLDEAAARRMMRAQMPAERKRDRADVVLVNDGTMKELEREAEGTWSEIERRAGARA